MLTRKTQQETQFTIGELWTAFSTRSAKRESRPWWKWDSCRKRFPRIPSPTNTIFRTGIFLRAGRIRRRTTRSGKSWYISSRSICGNGTAKGGQELAVGSVERAGHRLLERQPGRVFRIIRLRGSRNFASGAGREGWWAGYDGSGWREGGGVLAGVS